jgi:hypothetical protein
MVFANPCTYVYLCITGHTKLILDPECIIYFRIWADIFDKWLLNGFCKSMYVCIISLYYRPHQIDFRSRGYNIFQNLKKKVIYIYVIMYLLLPWHGWAWAWNRLETQNGRTIIDRGRAVDGFSILCTSFHFYGLCCTAHEMDWLWFWMILLCYHYALIIQ